MSDFRCPRYWWDGSQWRCQNLPNDYLSSYDFDTYCTNKNRCLECPYMDSEVREKVAAYKKDVDERVEEHVEEQRREYEEEQRNKENDYSYRENNNTSSTTTYSSSDSSDTGCLSTLFSLVFVVIGAIFALLWPILKIFINAFWLTPLIGASWIGFGCCFLVILSAPVGVIPLVVVLVTICCVIEIAFFPYWLILMWQKIKKYLNWKEVWSYYVKWFFKGPVAYVELANLLNETNTMPKVANLLGIIIGWFKKVFKKK